MSLAAALPVLIELGKTGFSIAQGNKAKKKQGNVQRDYEEHVSRFDSVLSASLDSQVYALGGDEKSFLANEAQKLKSALDSNPYAFDGEGVFSSRYDEALNGKTISNYNIALRGMVEDYLDAKKMNGTGTLLGQPSLNDPKSPVRIFTDGLREIVGAVEQLNLNGKRVIQDLTPPQAAAVKPNYTPWILGGAALIVIVLLFWRRK